LLALSKANGEHNLQQDSIKLVAATYDRRRNVQKSAQDFANFLLKTCRKDVA
jgi:hypothetical protein